MGSCVGVPVPPPPPQPRVTELETTTSTCTTDALRRKHVFEIQGYRSLLIRLAPRKFIRSAKFEVGGVDWAVSYYPYGDKGAKPGYASVSVDLMTSGINALASCEFSLVPWSETAGTGAPTPVLRTKPKLLGHGSSAPGTFLHVKRRELEAPAYLHDDNIRIECAVTVFKLPRASVIRSPTPPPTPEEQPPQPKPVEPAPDLSSYFAKLLDPNGGGPTADVYFHVGSEIFSAHRLVLWERCRKLYDRTKTWPVVVIPKSEVAPSTFKALLHYIYTESLPAMDDLSSANKSAMLKSLLASANLYGVEKLKVACQKALEAW